MFIVREIFHLQFGRFKEARSLVAEGMRKGIISNIEGGRFLTDFTGEGYRFMMELPFKSLADYEAELNREMSGENWQQWYEDFKKLIRYSEREILKEIII